MGDVKLLAMLAAWLGLRQTALVFFLAVVVGAAYGLLLIVARQVEGRIHRWPTRHSLWHVSELRRAVQHLSR